VSLNEHFSVKTEKAKLPKSLRLHAREAAEYLSGIPYEAPEDTMKPIGRTGRGARGESST
jgi:hypothetical protein